MSKLLVVVDSLEAWEQVEALVALTYLVAIDNGDWGFLLLLAFLLDYRDERRLKSRVEGKNRSLRAFNHSGIELHLQGKVHSWVLHGGEPLTVEGL